MNFIYLYLYLDLSITYLYIVRKHCTECIRTNDVKCKWL